MQSLCFQRNTYVDKIATEKSTNCCECTPQIIYHFITVRMLTPWYKNTVGRNHLIQKDDFMPFKIVEKKQKNFCQSFYLLCSFWYCCLIHTNNANYSNSMYTISLTFYIVCLFPASIKLIKLSSCPFFYFYICTFSDERFVVYSPVHTVYFNHIFIFSLFFTSVFLLWDSSVFRENYCVWITWLSVTRNKAHGSLRKMRIAEQ